VINSAPLCYGSAKPKLILFLALGWPRKNQNTLLLDGSDFPDWIYLLRGIRGFIDLAGVPSTGPLAPLFSHSISRYMLREGPDASTSSAHRSLTELEATILQRPIQEDLRQTYLIALKELKKSFGQAEACTTPYEMTDAFTWVFLVAEDLIPLLRVPEQEAVAIFAFWCVLLKKLDGHWWMQGWARHLIAHAYELLDEDHRWWIHWAIGEVGWIPPSALQRR
jgi:hypothetical protein